MYNKFTFTDSGSLQKGDLKKIKIPLLIVEYYFKNGSLRKTAKEFNIHYQTLFKWVKLYREIQKSDTKKEIIKEKLLTGYRRPWNRTEREIEEKVALLKERNPCLTVRKAKEILEKEGIRLSLKGIWNIWKRYGYTESRKKNFLKGSSLEYHEWTREMKVKYRNARRVFKAGNLKKAAEILNSLPLLPQNDLILKIPDKYLNLRRRKEKLISLFRKIPMSSYAEMVEFLYKELIRKDLIYSAVEIGIVEAMSFLWLYEPVKALGKINELQRVSVKNRRDFSSLPCEFRFFFHIVKSLAYLSLLKVKKAYRNASICGTILRNRKNPSLYYLRELAALYMVIGDFKKAEYWFFRVAENLSEKMRKKWIYPWLSQIYFMKGEYKKAIQLMLKSETNDWIRKPWLLHARSVLSLVNGIPGRAITLSEKCISLSRKEALNIGIFNSAFTTACAYHSMGEHERGNKIITELLPFLSKKGLFKEKAIFEILLGKKPGHTESFIIPAVKLALLLKSGKYYQALQYAEKKGIGDYFYRYILFFPWLVKDLLVKGKNTGLPKSYLRLPVFNSEAPVYDIRFLGKLIIYRSKTKDSDREVSAKERLRIKLTPREKAFLIHIALKIPEPGRTISLEKIFHNFWRYSGNPERNLSHLLTKIRKNLKIPSHLLEISRRGGMAVLRNNGIYFLTDYLEFREKITRARTFLRAGEWEFARREFLNAFRLIRGEPFKKMYDRWSEDTRLGIIFEIEKEMLNFIDECIKRKEIKVAGKIVKKGRKVFKYSDKFDSFTL